MNESTPRKNLPLLFEQKNYCDGSTDWCLDVRFTAFCDNRCVWCIAAEDMKNAREFHMDNMLAAIQKVKDRGISGLSIIGGEPLLFLDKLNEFMGRVQKESPFIENMYLTTSLPYTIKSQREKFDSIMEKTAVLNVSIQHYDTNKNNLILDARKRYDRIGLLEELLSHEPYRDQVRVHLNLTRGGIDSAAELNKALYTLREIGVKDIKLNELMNAPEDYVSFEDITGERLASPYANGCSTMIDYFPGLNINLKRSCFIVESSRAAAKEDLLKLMWKEELGYLGKKAGVPRVLYEDGTITDRWQGDAI